MDLSQEMAEVVNAEKQDKPKGLKLDTKRTMLIGLAFLSISIFWQVYDSYMPLFLQDFDLGRYKETMIGVIMALDNILALVMLPVIGFLSDNFPQRLRNKYGRRVPFIVLGSIVAALIFILVNIAHINRLLGLMISMTVLLVLFMNVYRTPAVSLMPDITPKKLRSGANAIINIMGAAGMAIALVVSMIAKKTIDGEPDKYGVPVKMLNPAEHNWIIIGVTCAAMIVVAVIFIFFVKENKFVKEKNGKLKNSGSTEEVETKQQKVKIKEVIGGLKSRERVSLLFILLSVFLWYMAYNALTTRFSTYSFVRLGEGNFETPLLIGNVAAFVMFIPSSLIAKKIGRKNTILIGVGLMIAAFALGSILQFTAPVSAIKIAMYPVFILTGAGWATINVHSFVMSVELATERTNGVFTGFYYAFAMGAQALTPVISGAIIDAFGGVGGGFDTLLPYALVFSCLAFLTMLPVKHGNSKDRPVTPQAPLKSGEEV